MLRRPIMPNRPRKTRPLPIAKGYRPGLLEAIESAAAEIDALQDAGQSGRGKPIRGTTLFAGRHTTKP